MRLDAELARRVMATMNAPGQGYRSLDEFVSVAVLNQLNTEMSVGDTVAAGPDRLELWRVHSLLARPAGDGAATGTVDALAVSDGLFILTNRLSPLKVATRVLANLRGLVDRLPGGRGWPTLKTLQTTAGHAARALGFELRRLDRLRTATHRDRRWTGYPVGRDERASLDRFTVSFTLTATSTAVSGPLVVLGLAATTKGGRVALTRAGERLAAAPSPLLDGFGAGTLSEEERVLLTGQIGRAPGERAAVVEFLELVGLADGSQKELDGGLGRRHAGWSRNRTTAHRAALVGRLCELGLLEAQGRGTSARLRPLPSAEQFLEECGSRRT